MKISAPAKTKVRAPFDSSQCWDYPTFHHAVKSQIFDSRTLQTSCLSVNWADLFVAKYLLFKKMTTTTVHFLCPQGFLMNHGSAGLKQPRCFEGGGINLGCFLVSLDMLLTKSFVYGSCTLIIQCNSKNGSVKLDIGHVNSIFCLDSKFALFTEICSC